MQIGRTGYHENARSHGYCTGHRTHQQAEPHFHARRHDEMTFHQTKYGVDHKREAEPYRGPSAVVMRQKHHTDNGPDTDSGQHRPQPPRQGEQPAPDRGLPDICDKGRDDEDRGGLRRRHHEAKQADRHRRQAKTDHALDETRQQKGPGNGGENCG
jgi:hypothetical protein